MKEPDECVDFGEFSLLLDELFGKIKESVKKHGRWDRYGVNDVFEAVAGEFDEYREAVVTGDIVGPHGQIDELMDVAVVALKGVLRLRC